MKNHVIRSKRFGNYNLVIPDLVGISKQITHDQRRAIPNHIQKPNYFETGVPELNNNIELKTKEDLMLMRSACALAKQLLVVARQKIAPGITTNEIDEALHTECINAGAYPSPLNYMGFPKSICTSVSFLSFLLLFFYCYFSVLILLFTHSSLFLFFAQMELDIYINFHIISIKNQKKKD